MGNTYSLRAEAKFLDELEHGTVQLLLEKYLELDMEFGIGASDVLVLFKECGLPIAETQVKSLMSLFPNKDMLNALDFLEGINMVLQGASMEAKAGLAFDIFDFQQRGEISFDELTIMIMSVTRGTSLLLGLESETHPDDDKIAEMIRSEFKLTQDREDDISKETFLSWFVRKWPEYEDQKLTDVLEFLSCTKIINGQNAIEETSETKEQESPTYDENKAQTNIEGQAGAPQDSSANETDSKLENVDNDEDDKPDTNIPVVEPTKDEESKLSENPLSGNEGSSDAVVDESSDNVKPLDATNSSSSETKLETSNSIEEKDVEETGTPATDESKADNDDAELVSVKKAELKDDQQTDNAAANTLATENEKSNDEVTADSNTEAKSNDEVEATEAKSNDEVETTEAKSNDEVETTEAKSNDEVETTEAKSNDEVETAEAKSNDEVETTEAPPEGEKSRENKVDDTATGEASQVIETDKRDEGETASSNEVATEDKPVEENVQQVPAVEQPVQGSEAQSSENASVHLEEGPHDGTTTDSTKEKEPPQQESPEASTNGIDSEEKLNDTGHMGESAAPTPEKGLKTDVGDSENQVIESNNNKGGSNEAAGGTEGSEVNSSSGAAADNTSTVAEHTNEAQNEQGKADQPVEEKPGESSPNDVQIAKDTSGQEDKSGESSSNDVQTTEMISGESSSNNVQPAEEELGDSNTNESQQQEDITGSVK